ncbi:MAG: hypothetical protein Q8N86_00415, partial [Atribacterota bacterium]|nr:hypothetical protein [Atribacterota bacterium]
MQDKFDKAYIISGDSDLIPSVEAVKALFPHKQIGVIIPIGRRAELLKLKCDFHMKIKEKHLRDLVVQIRELEREVEGNISYNFVSREKNKIADQLV